MAKTAHVLKAAECAAIMISRNSAIVTSDRFQFYAELALNWIENNDKSPAEGTGLG